MNKITASSINSLRLDNSISNKITLRQKLPLLNPMVTRQSGLGSFLWQFWASDLRNGFWGSDDSGYNLHMVTGGPSLDETSGRNIFKLAIFLGFN